MSSMIFRSGRAAAFYVLVIGAVVWLTEARAAELVVFERAGCPWCIRWNREVAPVYPLSEEGKRAPLRRVDITAGVPPDLGFVAPVRFTPTFVLVDKGREIGRLIGYMGEDAFWGMLGRLLQSVAPVDRTTRACIETKCP